MSLSLRFLSKVVSTCFFALLALSTYAVTDCSVGYKPQTNPFSRWSGCGVADNGIGETSSTANGEWSASFSFGDFITVKGNAYCLNEQYPMPQQKTSCDNYAFPVVENVNTTKTGNVCWCQVTAWQPYTVKRDAPFQEIEAKYIQIPVNAIKSCNLASCGDICASIGDSTGRTIGLEHSNAGLRAAIYNSIKECVTDESYTPETCAEWEHEQENPLASKWSNCGILEDYSAGSYGADGENGDWYASFDISDFVHTIRGKAYCVEQIPNTPAETPDNKQGICGSYSFAISETIDTARTGNYCWCQVTEYKTDNNTDFKPVQSAYIGLPTAFTNPSCTPKLCAQACATVGDYSSGRRTNFDNLARRDNVGLRAAMYQSVKQCVSDESLPTENCSAGYEYSSTTSQCEAITYTISYELNGGTNNSNNPSSYTIETPTITLQDPTKSGFDFVGWFWDENGNKVTEITTNSYGDRTLYAEWTEIPIENLYTVNWAAGVHGMGNMLAWSNKHASDMITLPSNNFNAQNGYVFDGWNCDNDIGDKAVGAIFYMPEADVTCTAQWRVISVSECEPGYYSSSNGCVICEENHYCTGGENSSMQNCPSGLVSPTGTISADNCGKIMLVGENVLYLTQVQQTTPALAVKVDGKTYYAKTTPISQIEQPSEHFLRTKIDGVEYSIHDNTVQRRN